MATASQSITHLAQAVEARSAPKGVELLNPRVQVKGKDKVDHEQMP